MGGKGDCTMLFLSKGGGLYHMKTGKRIRAVPFRKAIVIGTTDQYLIVPQGNQGARVIHQVASSEEDKSWTSNGL